MQDIQGDIVTEQWIKTHKINIPRAAGVWQSQTAWVRVDRHGTIVGAGPHDQHLVVWLADRQILSDIDLEYAAAYVTCRGAYRAYRKQREYKACIEIPGTSSASSLSCEQAAEVFSLVCTGIGRKYLKIIEYACDTTRTSQTSDNYRPPYRLAFSALIKAFDDATTQIKGSSH